MTNNDKEIIVKPEEIHRLVSGCLTEAGACREHADQLAELLVEADLRGHYSHGLNRLDFYALYVKEGMISGHGEPVILKEKAAAAWVDGQNLLGPTVGVFCMDLAIKKAKEAGVGWVVCKRSNHFGIAGYYAMRAMKAGMLGMSFTNGSPITYPTRSSQKGFATNPISVATGGENGDSFVLDMATSTVAYGKIELADRKGEAEIPPGWGCDSQGRETRVTEEALLHKGGGGTLPLGGSEITGGYKGYGLVMMGEIFSGILSDSAWGPDVVGFRETGKETDLGHCFIAIDPSAFAPGFSGRMQDLMNTCRNLTPVDPEKPVLVPGDPEESHMEKCRSLGGIPYHKNQIDYALDLAKEYKLNPPLQF